MSNTDTSELLRLCDEVIYATQPGEYTAMTSGEMAKVCEDAAPHLARALKPRLQAEAPEDAEVAEIEKRHADCEAFYSNHGPFRPTWQLDRTILLAKLRARTSQAEAQAPTTAVLTEIENLLDSLRKREEAAWGMASMFLENRDAHGVMDAGSELESLRRAISEIEKLL